MGGQTALPGSLHIDMSHFNKVLDFSPTKKEITVQAGIRWRDIQEVIDPQNLSIKIMQTYANFTVGGSLSVNAHGRYVGSGPVIQSVKSIKVVLANGNVVTASPSIEPDIFYGVIGGYGGLGVITEVTLNLTENIRVKRKHHTLHISEYKNYFLENIFSDKKAIFHNADIDPYAPDHLTAITYWETQDPVTIPARLLDTDQSYIGERFTLWVLSEWPLRRFIRKYLVDPIRLSGEPVTWRNHEASYDVSQLEPKSRKHSTYALAEFFIPIDNFEKFSRFLISIQKKYNPQIINISVRHATQDPGTYLAWAPQPVFSFVIYYKQGVDSESINFTGIWLRELIDGSLHYGGTFYLPYQIHATKDQFSRGYPRSSEFFQLKKKLDPTNKFQNQLWKAYHP